MNKKNNRANSAKANESKQVKSNAEKQVKTIEATAAAVIEDVKVETIETQSEATAAALPVAKEIGGDKVSSKEVLKAAGSLRAAVKEERRGANCTIRLIAERAANGDAAAVDILCALCDVPRAALYSLNIDIVRAAVNAYYPYYIETDGRKVSAKARGVWYTGACDNEDIAEAAKRVTRGYIVTPVVDYLEQLITAAKCRAKGITPRRVEAGVVYSDNKLSTAANGITAAEIDAAKQRRVYSPGAANVWHKNNIFGFYI